MRISVLAAMLLVPVVGTAADISIGGVSLQIPNPSGFSAVTQQMGELYQLQKQFVASTNEEFVSFIPDSDVQAALAGQIPDLPRRFTVQTAKTFVGISVTTSDFAKLKSIIKSQNDEIMKKVEKNIPGLMKQLNDGLTKKYDVDLAFSVSQMMPFAVHEETERTLAYSALIKYNMSDAAGNPAPFVTAATMTLVHVKGKVLFLYSYAEETGLQWSRDASKQWVSAVVAANPSNLQSSVKEFLPAAVTGMNGARAEPGQ